MINIVMIDRILEITERRTRFQKIKQMVSNWKSVCIVAVLALTLKSAAEQLVLLLK
jgi:hypothetical protein